MASTMKVIVAEKFGLRKRQGNTYIYGMVMEVTKPAAGGDVENAGSAADGAHVFGLFVNENVTDEKVRRQIMELQVGKRAIITNVLKYPGSGRLTPKSKVITNVSAFPYDVEGFNGFVRPATVSVAEAKGSAKKRRLSVEGDVVEVGGCVTTPDYARRAIKIQGGGTSMEVILWGSAATQEWSPSKKVTITALIKEERRLTSTPSTIVEMSLFREDRGEIIGIGDMENGYPIEVILDSGASLFVGEGVPFNFEVVLPHRVVYRATESGMVESMTAVEEEEEEEEEQEQEQEQEQDV